MLSTRLKSVWAACGLALALAAPATAGEITFEAATPGTFVLGGFDTYSEGGFDFGIVGDFGVIDTAAAYGPGAGLDLAPPRGNDTQFMTVLNDSFLTMSASDGSLFRFAGLDVGYVSPLVGFFFPGESIGMLLALYEAADGTVGSMGWDLGVADANGEFNFFSIGLDDVGALASGVRAIAFGACAYDGLGGCDQFSGGFSQFAVDNLRVPEPGTAALLALGLFAVGKARRRARGHDAA